MQTASKNLLMLIVQQQTAKACKVDKMVIFSKLNKVTCK